MNTGAYDDLLPRKELKAPDDDRQVVSFADFSAIRFPIGSKCTEQGMWYYKHPRIFSTGQAIVEGGVEVAANDDTDYRIDFLNGDNLLDRRQVPATSNKAGNVKKYCFPIDETLRKAGLNGIRWEPLVGNYACFSYIRLVDSCDKPR